MTPIHTAALARCGYASYDPRTVSTVFRRSIELQPEEQTVETVREIFNGLRSHRAEAAV